MGDEWLGKSHFAKMAWYIKLILFSSRYLDRSFCLVRLFHSRANVKPRRLLPKAETKAPIFQTTFSRSSCRKTVLFWFKIYWNVFAPKWPFTNKSAYIQIVACCRTGTELRFETVDSLFTDTHMRHLAWMNYVIGGRQSAGTVMIKLMLPICAALAQFDLWYF